MNLRKIEYLEMRVLDDQEGEIVRLRKKSIV